MSRRVLSLKGNNFVKVTPGSRRLTLNIKYIIFDIQMKTTHDILKSLLNIRLDVGMPQKHPLSNAEHADR